MERFTGLSMSLNALSSWVNTPVEFFCCLLFCALFSSLAGCGGDSSTSESPSANLSEQRESPSKPKAKRSTSAFDRPQSGSEINGGGGLAADPSSTDPNPGLGQSINRAEAARGEGGSGQPPTDSRMLENRSADNVIPRAFQLPQLDEPAIEALGISKIKGVHLTLFTDVRSDEPAEFVKAFDQAVTQWADYFQTEPPMAEQFQVRGCFIREPRIFRRCGLLPTNLPDFPHGYQLDARLWVYEKPGPYFSRHQILHEGVHAFIRRFFGGLGAAWYTEGLAELLACHSWSEDKVRVNQVITSAADAPNWGRVKLIKQAIDNRVYPSLREVMSTPQSAFRSTEPYAWCWAACHFLDRNPQYQTAFRSMPELAADHSQAFTNQLVKRLEADWDEVEHQWQLFIQEIEYGYDVSRESIQFSEPRDLGTESHRQEILADQGWQSTGLQVTAGQAYEIHAEGRVVLGQLPIRWETEPDGVTIHYYRGIPAGSLLAAVIPAGSPRPGKSPLVTPTPIGQHLVFQPQKTGTLFLRVNDLSTSLKDNAGAYQVQINQRLE